MKKKSLYWDPVREEKMEAKETEFYLGESKFYLSEDDIIYANIVGDLNEKMAVPLQEGFLKLILNSSGKVNVLADLNRCGKPAVIVRRKGLEIAKNERISKIALFGVHPVARIIASFWMPRTQKPDIRFFKTKEEALLWLKQQE